MMYRTSPITVHLFADNGTVDPVSEIFKTLSDASECKPQRANRWETVEPAYSQETKNDGTFLELDLPGVEKSDIAVEVRNRRLVVVGKRFRNEQRGEGTDDKKLTAGEDAADAADAPHEEKQVPNETKPATGCECENAAQTEHQTVKKDTADDKQVPVEAKCSAGKRVCKKMYRIVFRLAPNVDVDAITVDCHRDGVLRLRLPHAKKQEPRKIAVL